MFFRIFFILGIICTIIFLIRRDEHSSFSAVILKICASMMFIATAAAGLYESKGDLQYGLLIIMGLVFGLLGDIWLDLKWVYPNDKRYFMYGGFFFFLFGHLCFSTAVILGASMSIKDVLQCLIVPVLVGIAFPFASKLMLDVTGFRCITSLYSAGLAFTATTSATALMQHVGTAQILMVVGAGLFIFSDFILCNTYFGNRMTSRPFVVINHLLYYAAQFCIAVSIFYK